MLQNCRGCPLQLAQIRVTQVCYCFCMWGTMFTLSPESSQMSVTPSARDGQVQRMIVGP